MFFQQKVHKGNQQITERCNGKEKYPYMLYDLHACEKQDDSPSLVFSEATKKKRYLKLKKIFEISCKGADYQLC